MSTDSTVKPQDLLAAITDLRRRGVSKIMEEVESYEVELSNYYLEELSMLHSKLQRAVPHHRDAQRLYRHAQQIVLVSVQAMRLAQARLWSDAMEANTTGASPKPAHPKIAIEPDDNVDPASPV